MDPSGIADRMRSIQETVAAATVEVTSDDNAVTVVAGPAGAVRGLRFGPRAFRYSGAELGEIVVRTIREAHTLVGRELTASLAGLAGQPSGPAPFSRPQSPDRLRAGLDDQPDEVSPDAGRLDAGRPGAGRPGAGRPDAPPSAGRLDAGQPGAGRPGAASNGGERA